MISLDSLSITKEHDHQLVTWRVDHPKFPKTLWAKVYNVDTPISPSDAGNWAVLSLIVPAMALGEDVTSDALLHPEVHFNISRDLQKLLVYAMPGLRPINITAKIGTPEIPQAGRGVATAFSAGVDSFFTLKRYLSDDTPDHLRVSVLTTFNVGGLGRSANSAPLFKKYTDRVKSYAASKGLDWATIDSNIDDFFVACEVPFNKTASMRNSAASMLLAGKIHTYLYSSSVSYVHINSDIGDLSDFDLPIFSVISTPLYRLISAGAGESRLSKTIALADYPDAFENLDVCTSDPTKRAAAAKPNCSRCGKCLTTALTLQEIGALKNFEAVFDLDVVALNRRKALKLIAKRAKRGSELSKDIHNLIKQRRRERLVSIFGTFFPKGRHAALDQAGADGWRQ